MICVPEEVKLARVKPSRKERDKPILFPSGDRVTRVAPAVRPKQEEKPKPAPVTSKDGATQPAANRRSGEVGLGKLLATLAESSFVRQWIGKGPSTRDDDGWDPDFFDSEEESDAPTV